MASWNLDVCARLFRLLRTVRRTTGGYRNSAEVVRIEDDRAFERTGCVLGFPLDPIEVLVASAISEQHALLLGPPGCGKTALATAVLSALFGKAWQRLQVDSALNEDELFGPECLFRPDGPLADQERPGANLTQPGLLLEAVDRGYPRVTQRLLHVLDRDLCLRGATVPVGHAWRDAEGVPRRYQWSILTACEGDEHPGVFALDPALRHHATVELPLDLFAPTELDRRDILMMQGRRVGQTSPSANIDLRAVLQLVAEVAALPIGRSAELYLHYLKGEDPAQGVRELSLGTWLNLARLARAFAGLRGARALGLALGRSGDITSDEMQVRHEGLEAWLQAFRPGQAYSPAAFVRAYAEELRVEDRDVFAALPLLGPAKLGIDPSRGERERVFDGHAFMASQRAAGRSWSRLADFRRRYGAMLELMESGGRVPMAGRKALSVHEHRRDARIVPALEAWSGRRLRTRRVGMMR